MKGGRYQCMGLVAPFLVDHGDVHIAGIVARQLKAAVLVPDTYAITARHQWNVLAVCVCGVVCACGRACVAGERNVQLAAPRLTEVT
jgi:hypothetical protein